MKKAVLFAVGITAAALVLAQGEGALSLGKTTKALNDAQGLKASYGVQPIGGSPMSYTFEFGKPSFARLESNARLIVADGKNITVLDKVKKTYFTKPQTLKDLKKALQEAGATVWLSFFDPKAETGASDVRSLPNVTRRGMNLSVVQFKRYDTTYTYYLGSDFVPRQAQMATSRPGKQETIVVNASSVEVLAKADATRFAFKAPPGSRELTAAEIDSGKWYTNYEEALAAAKATNRLVLIDFYTGWCHWCKVLREEVFPKDEFKAMSKSFVFCEIDAEAETALASKYGVKAYPTSVFVDGDGKEVHRLEGYKALDGYLAEMNTALQNAGK